MTGVDVCHRKRLERRQSDAGIGHQIRVLRGKYSQVNQPLPLTRAGCETRLR